jgi:hypothetical protein
VSLKGPIIEINRPVCCRPNKYVDEAVIKLVDDRRDAMVVQGLEACSDQLVAFVREIHYPRRIAELFDKLSFDGGLLRRCNIEHVVDKERTCKEELPSVRRHY